MFAKLVSYTFLYWLPLYISNVGQYFTHVFFYSMRRVSLKKNFPHNSKLMCVCFLFFFSAHFDAKQAGDMSTLFDVGGILGKLSWLRSHILRLCWKNISRGNKLKILRWKLVLLIDSPEAAFVSSLSQKLPWRSDQSEPTLYPQEASWQGSCLTTQVGGRQPAASCLLLLPPWWVLPNITLSGQRAWSCYILLTLLKLLHQFQELPQ